MHQPQVSPVKALPPLPNGRAGNQGLKAMLTQRTILAALQSFHREMGIIFRLPMPGFSPIVLAGPEAAHFLMACHRTSFGWHVENDPVSRLLRRGLLMQDGAAHDDLRRKMSPPLHRSVLGDYTADILRYTDRLANTWSEVNVYDMHGEMRRLALMVLIGILIKVEAEQEVDWLVPAVHQALKLISPGLWLIWRDIPRPGDSTSLKKLDGYLYQLITDRRAASLNCNDLFSRLVCDPDMDDDLIRDQLMTMLIAGHDTSASLLSWVIYLLGEHPEVASRARMEVNEVFGENPPSADKLNSLVYLGQVIDETLRLFPPIHAGNSLATEDLEFQGWFIPAGSRVLFSIYLTHRHKDHWVEPDRFDPLRFAPGEPAPRSYTYIPFGKGPRNCLGAAFAQMEAKMIQARLLQRPSFSPIGRCVHPQMGASLDPHPGVWQRVHERREYIENYQ